MSAFIYLSERGDMLDDVTTALGNAFGVTTGFPFENVLTPDITELWVSAPVSGGLGMANNLTIDLGSSRSWDLFVIANHNIPSTATITLKSGTTSSVLDNTDVVTWREGDIYIRLAAPRTHRYIKLFIVDAAMADGETISVGRFMLGLSTVSAVPPTYRWRYAPIVKASDNRSAFNVKNIDVFCKYRVLQFPFMNQIGNAAAVTFLTFLESLQGMRYWFFLIPLSTEYHGYVVRLVSQVGRIRTTRNDFDDVVVEEESRGVRIGA